MKFSPIFILAAAILISGCSSLKILAPSNNNTIETLEPEFTWNYSNSKLQYFELQLAESSDFKENRKLFKLTKQNSFKLTIPYLKNGNRYFWSVRPVMMDSKTGQEIKGEWAYENDKAKIPYSFLTSEEAEGDDQLDEGQKEEINLTGVIENITRLTFDDNDEFAPAISSNGQYLAFVSNRSGNFEIFVKDLESGGTGEIQRTFSSKEQNNLNPFWLNDNVNFGFFTNRLEKDKWHLFTSTEGKGLTLVSTSVSFVDPDWLYGSASEDNGNMVYAVRTTYSAGSIIWLYNSESAKFTQLVPGSFPDIRKDNIAYTAEKAGNLDIWKMELEGNSIFRETQLTFDQSWDYDPSWSPDGSRIAFVSHRSGNSDIWVMDATGANLTQVTFDPLVDRRPQWINGNTLVFQSNRSKDKDGNPTWDIWQISLNF